MRYLEVRIEQSEAERNPMHQLLVERDEYGASRLLAREQFASDDHAMLFHVEGPSDPFRETLDERSAVEAFAVGECADDSFYLYAREHLSGTDRAFSGAFSQSGLVLVTPVVYQTDGSVRVTAVGPADAVQAAVEAVPASMNVQVLTVGNYEAARLDSRLELTQRQFEAVEVAVETGYYSATREATLAAVADRLDCSTGTAGELLRRAERTVMSTLVSRGPF